MKQPSWKDAPTGATHWDDGDESRDIREGWLMHLGGDWYFWDGCWFYSDEDAGGDRSNSFIKRPDPSSEWDGEGIPHAGAMVECILPGGNRESGVVVGEFSGRIYVGFSDDNSVCDFAPEFVKPAKTEADRIMDEIKRLYAEGGPAAVYDAGYRKQGGDA